MELWNAAHEEDHQRAQRLYENLLGTLNAIDHPSLHPNVNTALRLQGRDAGFPRAPMPQSSPDQEEEIRHAPARMRRAGGCVSGQLC